MSEHLRVYDDFTGFTFNGKHCSEFGLLRVSDGDRYEDDLVLSLSDESAEVPGGVGHYYWGENIKQREFSISVAYDSVTEKDKRLIRKWLHPDDKLHELIFDEKPYVKYWVKCSKQVTAKELCFNENIDGKVRRIYKGEFQLEFTAYMPYGVNRWNYLPEIIENTENSLDPEYGNLEEWAESSKLLFTSQYKDINQFSNNFAKIYNPGDVETGFELSFKKSGATIELKKINRSKPEDNSPFRFATKNDLINNLVTGSGWFVLNPGWIGLQGTLENTATNDGESGYIDTTMGDNCKFISNITGEIYDVYIDVSDRIDGNPFNYFTFDIPRGQLTNWKKYCTIDANGSTWEFVCWYDSTSNIHCVRFLQEGLTYNEVPLILYMLPNSNSVINFGIKDYNSNSFLDNYNFTFTIPNGSSINPKYWTEAQKMLYLPCEVKIDTNKQTIQYREIINEAQKLYGNWVGISGIVSKGKLFKVPVDEITNEENWNIPTMFREFHITQEQSNDFGNISNLSLTYPYLYI